MELSVGLGHNSDAECDKGLPETAWLNLLVETRLGFREAAL